MKIFNERTLRYTENKFAKSSGLIYKAKTALRNMPSE